LIHPADHGSLTAVAFIRYLHAHTPHKQSQSLYKTDDLLPASYRQEPTGPMQQLRSVLQTRIPVPISRNPTQWPILLQDPQGETYELPEISPNGAPPCDAGHVRVLV